MNPTALVIGVLTGIAWLAAAEFVAHSTRLRPFDWRVLFWILLTLNALDLATTRLALAAGVSEGNPLMRLVLSHGEWWLVGYKLAVGGIASFVVARLAHRSMSFRRIAFAFLIALVFVVLWNIAAIWLAWYLR